MHTHAYKCIHTEYVSMHHEKMMVLAYRIKSHNLYKKIMHSTHWHHRIERLHTF